MAFSCLPPRKYSQKNLRLPLLTKAKNMIIISLSKKSLWTFSPSCFQNCKIEFCSIILQFCRCGGLWNAKGHPDGFLSHFSSLRNFRLDRLFDSLPRAQRALISYSSSAKIRSSTSPPTCSHHGMVLPPFCLLTLRPPIVCVRKGKIARLLALPLDIFSKNR